MDFTDPQKEELRVILNTPLMQKALQVALNDVLTSTYGEKTAEGASLAYKVAEGARMFVSMLFNNVDVTAVWPSTHRRFRTETTPTP